MFGVVTAAEFIGIAMFVAFVLWAVYWYTVVNFEILPSYGDITAFEKRYACVVLLPYAYKITFVLGSCLPSTADYCSNFSYCPSSGFRCCKCRHIYSV